MEAINRYFGATGSRDVMRRAAFVSLAVLVVAGAAVGAVRSRHEPSAATASNAGPGSTTVMASRAMAGAAPTAARESANKAASSGAGATSGGGVALDAVPPVPPGNAPSSSALIGPRIVRTADLQVRVRGSFTDAVERASAVATVLGGFVTSSSTSSFEQGRASGDLTMRVPAARFDDARHRLGQLGTLESAQVSGNDVGGQLVDLDARLRTLRAEEGALDTLLGRSTDIGTILQVRDRLTGVRTEIEQLAGQQASLNDQVALATVHVGLHEAGAPTPKPKPKPSSTTGISDSAWTAWHATEAVVGGMIVVLGALVPFLVLALLAWPLVRRRVRSRATVSP